MDITNSILLSIVDDCSNACFFTTYANIGSVSFLKNAFCCVGANGANHVSFAKMNTKNVKVIKKKTNWKTGAFGFLKKILKINHLLFRTRPNDFSSFMVIFVLFVFILLTYVFKLVSFEVRLQLFIVSPTDSGGMMDRPCTLTGTPESIE